MIPTIFDAAHQIRQDQLNPLDLLEQCLDRIDRCEPAVRAWVLVDREGARAQATRLAAELKDRHYRGPLHGIPIGIKDIFDVLDLPTAAGSELWKNSIARADSTAVKRLRQSGAIILGKTVTTQYASFDPPPTRNPWNLQRTPGGSSSGSAAAVACGMCPATLGSQTGGSITRPASFCGVAACKPTYGLCSLAGVVPLAHSMDHPGPMARCVRDLAIVLQAIAGPSSDHAAPMRAVPDYLDAIEHMARDGEAPTLGILHGLLDDLAEPPMKALMEGVQAQFRKQGAVLRSIALPASFSEVLARHRTVMAVEAASFHRERLERHPEDYQPNIRQLLEEGIRCPAPEYARCKEHQKQLTREMLACCHEVDALLCPATPGPAPDAATTGDPAFNSPWSYTGLPCVSLPGGLSADGLPLCMQLVGPSWKEARLFGVAAWCEHVLGFEPGEPSGIRDGPVAKCT